MKVLFHDDGWDDYLRWVDADPKIHRRLNELIEDVTDHRMSAQFR